MSKSAHTEAQIIGAVKQVEAGRKAEEVAREMGVSKHTIYAWKQKYGGLEVAEAQELKQLQEVAGTDETDSFGDRQFREEPGDRPPVSTHSLGAKSNAP